MEKNKNLWISIVVIILVLGFGYVLWNSYKPAAAPVVSGTTGDTTDQTALTPGSTEDITTGSVDTGKAVTLSYKEALVKYADARLQLDTKCQADSQSQNMTFKNNSYMMIDNRAPVSRTVHIGSVFTIKPYGFKIIQLSSTKLPVTWLVDCDSSQNVATISIQK